MTKTKKATKHVDAQGKWITFMVMTLLTIFFCGHLAAIIENGAGMDSWSGLLIEHILKAPFDFFHVNYYILYFAVCIYALIFFMLLSKRELPKAEMKGIEHGSNDFQTDEEREDFLKNNTTPIYPLDLCVFEKEQQEL